MQLKLKQYAKVYNFFSFVKIKDLKVSMLWYGQKEPLCQEIYKCKIADPKSLSHSLVMKKIRT
jgi:hypothetical protein